MTRSGAFGGVSTSSLIGVAIACGGNVLISLALCVWLHIPTNPAEIRRTIQKLAHRQQNPHHDDSAPRISHERADSPTDQILPAQVVEPAAAQAVAAERNLVAIPVKVDAAKSTGEVRVTLLTSSPPQPGDSHHDASEEMVEEGLYLQSRLWWVGMLLICCGEFGNFLSYGFAPASVVAPLGTVVSTPLRSADDH